MFEVRFESGATEESINQVAMFIRDLERLDFEANFPSVREGLALAIEHSDSAVTGFIDDEAAAIFGVGIRDGVAVPWLALTEDAVTHKMKVARHARAWARVLQEKYGHLENIVLAQDQPALDLLKFCGFTVDTNAERVIERNGLDYHFFWYGEAA
jgi:hypothetical protein